MSAASWTLQEAIYSCLESDSALITLTGTLRLYDEPPRDVSYPYLVFAADTETAWNTATTTGSEHTITIDIFSQSGGRKACKQIASAVRDALENTALEPDGQTLIGLYFKSASYTRLEDGATFQARISFTALTEPSS